MDVSGNVSLLGNAEAGDVFAETYALCGEAMAVDAVATSETVILFLPMKQLMHEKKCRIFVVRENAEANIIRMLSKKKSRVVKSYFLHNAKKIRDRVYTYLSMQRVRSGRRKFRIPFNRQRDGGLSEFRPECTVKGVRTYAGKKESFLSIKMNLNFWRRRNTMLKDKDIRGAAI